MLGQHINDSWKKMFTDQLGITMEVYINDILIKSKESYQPFLHLEETFWIVDHVGMRLNPTKCSFGVTSGKFFGNFVSRREIEAYLNQIKAILDMSPPSNKNDIQMLARWIVALYQFISLSSNKGKVFFSMLWGIVISNGHKNVRKLSKDWRNTSHLFLCWGNHALERDFLSIFVYIRNGGQ